jgi:hypothetical protein
MQTRRLESSMLEVKPSPPLIVAGIVILIAAFFAGVVVLPVLGLIGMTWGVAALLTRAQY